MEEDVPLDMVLSSTDPASFDALLLPGRVMNPDTLRRNPEAVKFVRHFFAGGKPVAPICHPPWMLVEAGVVRGPTLASWPWLKTDIQNAGGNGVDAEMG
jgi:protease I